MADAATIRLPVRKIAPDAIRLERTLAAHRTEPEQEHHGHNQERQDCCRETSPLMLQLGFPYSAASA